MFNLNLDILFNQMLRPYPSTCDQGKGCKVAGQEGDSIVTSHGLRSAKSVREWTLTLPNELPLWELDSQMDSQIFRAQIAGVKNHWLEKFFISLEIYWNLDV